MMQLDVLALYNADGEIRRIDFRPGQLNIITGESGTGKSSVVGILRFLLGGDSPHAPLGPIQNTVAWYGLAAHVEETYFWIARPAPPHGATTVQAMLSVGQREIPALDSLEINSNTDELVGYLGGLIGIEDNLNIPPEGNTRRPLAANLRHSLYYCFQGQGEVANPDLLFHHQNKDFQKQTIRDTLPYFLGAQDSETLRKRELLSELRRDVRRQSLLLDEARAARSVGLGRAAGLIAEARASGLLPVDAIASDAGGAFEMLSRALDAPVPAGPVEAVDEVGVTERLIAERAELRAQLRDIHDKMRGLDEFARVGTEYEAELDEHRVRLASIGLIPDAADPDAFCPVCETPLTDAVAKSAFTQSLSRVVRRLELAQRDRPRVAAARKELLAARRDTQAALADVDAALEQLARTEDVAASARQTWDHQSFVRGRIAQHLDTTVFAGDDAMVALEARVARLQEQVSRLSDELDPEALRSAVSSLLSIVGRRMTALAQSLPLEHSEHGVRIDPYRLTVVADTLQGPAYMDAGAIGSGMSWVGYHLAAYLALHDYFIEAGRPVPHFIVLDQPSQAFFPRDRQSGGDLGELSDADRNNTRKLFRMVYDVVSALAGQLQVIILDHADFDDDWFKASIVETWRGGKALIPSNWILGSDRGVQ